MPAIEGDSVGSALVCIGGVYRFHDDYRNEWIEIPVHIDLAEAIRKLDEGLARRERLHRQHVAPFTDVDVDDTTVQRVAPTRGPELPRYPGRPWQGPYVAFSRLLGTNVIWEGPPTPGPCRCCDGRRLEVDEYCIGCDRCGVPIRRATPHELWALRERKPRADGMPGGVGAARPKAVKGK